MYCPNCGQERVSVETNFCSRCGYLLTGTAELLQMGGVLPKTDIKLKKKSSPRSRGIKQGLFIFLLSFLVVPVLAIMTIAANAEPFAVAIAAVVLFVGGLLRIAYAFMFEQAEDLGHNERDDYMAAATRMFTSRGGSPALPPQQGVPADASFRNAPGGWRETRDLAPPSVTDSTTKLLEKEEQANH